MDLLLLGCYTRFSCNKVMLVAGLNNDPPYTLFSPCLHPRQIFLCHNNHVYYCQVDVISVMAISTLYLNEMIPSLTGFVKVFLDKK